MWLVDDVVVVGIVVVVVVVSLRLWCSLLLLVVDVVCVLLLSSCVCGAACVWLRCLFGGLWCVYVSFLWLCAHCCCLVDYVCADVFVCLFDRWFDCVCGCVFACLSCVIV